MSFDIPLSIEPMILQYANDQHISHEEALVRLVQSGFNAVQSTDNYDYIFTAERIRELDRISGEIEAGAKTFSMEEVSRHFTSKQEQWGANRQN